MQGRRSQIARLQSDFYRDQFRKTIRRLMVSVTVMFMLIAAIIYVVLTRPQQTYYANTTEGKILPMPGQG